MRWEACKSRTWTAMVSHPTRQWLLVCVLLLVAAHCGNQVEAAPESKSGTGAAVGTQAKAAAGTAPKDAGGALAFAIGLLDTTCDWPYQYYSDDQLTNIMSLAATKKMISPVSFSKRMANIEWQFFGCSSSEATIADFTSVFTLACLSDITKRNGADGVDTQFLGDEAEFALDLAAKMIENTCGTMYGKTAGSSGISLNTKGYTYKIAIACDIAKTIDKTMQTISKVVETFGLSTIADKVITFLDDTTKPFVDGCNEVQPKIQEFCDDVSKAGWLSYVYKFLEYRSKIGSGITWVNNIIGLLELGACFGDRANYAQMEATLGITRPSTKCQLAPGQTGAAGQAAVPDPAHCSSQYPKGYTPTSNSGRKLHASFAAPLNMTSDDRSSLGGQFGAPGKAGAARRLLDAIQPDTTLFSQVEDMSSKLSGVYNAYQDVHSAVAPIAQDISNVMSTMRSVIDKIDDFMAPFTPFEGIINTVQNILSYVQCPDLGPLNFICHLGEILDDALKTIMQAVGLPPIDEWLQNLIDELGIPTFSLINTGIMSQVTNSVMPVVNTTLQSFNDAYFGTLKNALSVSYWMGTFDPRAVETGVTLNRAIGQDGKVTITCPSGQYPITDTATRKLGSCSNEISGSMRYPCKNDATCNLLYAGWDTVCTASNNPAPSDSIATSILSDLGLSSVPGHDMLIVLFYCVDPKLSAFGPWPLIRSATPSFRVNYDAGWWGGDITVAASGPLDLSYGTGNPQLVGNASLQVTAAPKIHRLMPGMTVPSMFDSISSTLGGNLTCPGQRQLLINYLQPKSVPKSVKNAPDGAWDPCFTGWLLDNSTSSLPSIPAGTPYTAQQLVSMVKQELCFFKWYSTFNTSSPAPWVTDPQTTNIYVKSTVLGYKMDLPIIGWGPLARNKICMAYYNDTSDPFNAGCYTDQLADQWTLGTFSYIDAVYGPDNDSNFLCNGLSHGSLWGLTRACYTGATNGFANSAGSFMGFTSGNRSAAIDFIYAINNYTGTCSIFSGGSAPLSTDFFPGFFCCDYGQCTYGCYPWFFQTPKSSWKTMCDNGYAYPAPVGDLIPSSSWAAGSPSFSAAQDQAFRTAHRAIRQAVLDSYNAAIASGSAAAACATALQQTCGQTSNCNPSSTGCYPENLQVACVEPKYFDQTFPTYTAYLWGDAVAGSDGRTASVTCPSSTGMVAQLMSAALGPVNSFTVTIDAGPQYSSVACSGASCNLDITYFAKVYASLPSASGYFLKTVVKCACGPGYQSMTPAANSTSGNNNTSPTGSASLTCNPCGAGWYRDSTMGDCAPCPLGYYQTDKAQTACLPCPAGTFANKTGTVNCTLCAAGTFSAAVAAGDSSMCQSCPINTYTKVNGSTACTACALGWYTNSTGTGSNCTACEPGTYRDASMQSCAACAVGTYSSRGNSSCNPVPPGTAAASKDMDYAEQCPFGSYTSTTDQPQCISCNSSYPTTTTLGANGPSDCTLASSTSVSAVNWTDTAQAAYPDDYKAYNAALCAQFLATYGGNFSQIGNGFCNQGPYNVAMCNWDGGDCCPDTCVPATYFDYGSNTTKQYPLSCATVNSACWRNIAALSSSNSSSLRTAAQGAAGVKCLFNTPAKTKGGKCGTKDPKDTRLGNGVCDDELNTGDGVCAYDKGDCCVGSCVRNPGLGRSCTLYNFNCRDPKFAGTSKDVVPPTLPTKLGALVFHARTKLERNKPIPVVATDNDPCFSGVAYATIVSKEDMKKTKTCERHKYEYVVRATITAKDPAGNVATKNDVRVFVVDDVPPALKNVPLVKTTQLIPGASSRPSTLKLLKRNGPIPELRRDGRRRLTKVEVSKVTAAQLAALKPETAASYDDHPCHVDKVTFKEVKGVGLAELNKALAQAFVTPADRKSVIEFYTANSAAGSGNQVLRFWSVTDPAGNFDSVLQLLAVTA